MKKIYEIIAILFVMAFMANEIIAQENNAVYIVVNAEKTTTDEDIAKRSADVIRGTYYNQETYRDTIQTFRLYVKSHELQVITLWHYWKFKPSNLKSLRPNDQHEVYYKDSTFLNTVNTFYWEDFDGFESYEVRHVLHDAIWDRELNGRRRIYLVDLNEKHPDGKIKLYEVQIAGGFEVTTMGLDEEAAAEWQNRFQKIKDKVREKQHKRRAARNILA